MSAVEQLQAGMALLGEDVRFAHEPDGPIHRVLAVNANGMVTLCDMSGEFAPHLFVMAGERGRACCASAHPAGRDAERRSLPRDVAIAPAVSADGGEARLDTGEILLLPAALWQAIDAAIAACATIDDPAAARTAFAGAFAKGLHASGLGLVDLVDPRSTRTVSVQTYSLVLQGKHTVEAKLEAVTKAVKGWDSDTCSAPLLPELALGVLALAGRAPPDERRRLQAAFIRLRAVDAILTGSPTAGWDIRSAPPLPPELMAFFEEKIG